MACTMKYIICCDQTQNLGPATGVSGKTSQLVVRFSSTSSNSTPSLTVSSSLDNRRNWRERAVLDLTGDL